MIRSAALLWLLLLMPVQASAGLYEDMKGLVTKELSATETDDYVASYVATVFRSTYQRITAVNVQASVAGDWPALCAGIDGGNTLNRPDCAVLHERVRRLVADEQRVRSFGRKLQTIATGYEIVLSELPNGLLRLPIEFAGIANIWGTGTGAVRLPGTSGVAPATGSGSSGATIPGTGTALGGGTGTGYKIRTRALTTPEMNAVQPFIDQINATLAGLDDEQRVGAMWRYRYGYRLVTDEREPSYPAPIILQTTGSGAERQFLAKHWTDLETQLQSLWNALPDTFDPPLEADEAAYYILPEPIWARTDGNPANGYPLGDAGLQYPVALEPVLPSLLPEGYMDCLEGTSDPDACLSLGGPILGGNYPPEPKQGNVLLDDVGQCSQPVARRGFLCRPVSDVSPTLCPDPAGLDPDAITLTSCLLEGTERYAPAGPDACRETDWRQEPANVYEDGVEDPDSQCYVTKDMLSCTECEMVKDGNGGIQTCAFAPGLPATYGLIGGLVRAEQLCGFEPGYDGGYEDIDDDPDLNDDQKLRRKNVLCCQREGEVYRRICDELDKDGAFLDDDGNPIGTYDVERCYELYTEKACKEEWDLSCYPTRDYGDLGAINAAIANMESTLNYDADVPAACGDATDEDTMDLRLKSEMEELQPGYDPCTPLRETEYANKIGNNMCFIAQCAEQSLEEFRIQGGRIPAGVGGMAFPWDSPLSWSPKGTIILEPAGQRASFPPYNPRIIAQEMDLALCQIAGLPSMTPPVLCVVTAGERAAVPQSDPLTTAQAIVAEQRDQDNARSAVLAQASGYGARIGAELYGQYLHGAVRSLAGILDIANQLFTDIESIDFPTEMCPIDARLPEDYE